MKAAEDLIGALRPGLRGAWERYWFGEGSLVRLAAFRIAVLSIALYALTFFRPSLVQDDASLELVQRKFTPVYFLDVLGIGPQSPEFAAQLYWVIVAVLILGILGLFTRAMCVLAAVLMLYWMGTGYSWGKPHHEYGCLAFALWSLPFGPVGARLSIDSVLRRWKAGRGGRGAVAPAPERAEGALLPIHFTQLTLAGGYAFAAASKLAIGGTDWLNGYTLQAILLEFEEPMSRWVAEHLPLVILLSFSVIGIQLGSVWSVLWRPARWLFVPAVISMHLGSRQTMDTGTFFGLWGLQAAFINFEQLPGFLSRWVLGGGWLRRTVLGLLVGALFWGLTLIYLERAPAWTLVLIAPLALAGLIGWLAPGRLDFVFDGGCGLCRRSVVVIDALDWTGRVRFLPTTDWDAVAAAHPELDPVRCVEDIHMVDAQGRVRVGYEAYAHLAWRLPLLVPLALLMPLPPVRAIGERVYRRIADSRATSSCSIAPSEG